MPPRSNRPAEPLSFQASNLGRLGSLGSLLGKAGLFVAILELPKVANVAILELPKVASPKLGGNWKMAKVAKMARRGPDAA